MSSTSISQDMLPIVIAVCIVFLLLIALIVWMQRFFLHQILRPLRELQDFMVSHFNALFKRMTGMPPAQYRSKA